MSCASCSAHVEKAVKGVSGVSQVAVSLLTNSMTVEYDETAVNPAAIIDRFFLRKPRFAQLCRNGLLS